MRGGGLLSQNCKVEQMRWSLLKTWESKPLQTVKRTTSDAAPPPYAAAAHTRCAVPAGSRMAPAAAVVAASIPKELHLDQARSKTSGYRYSKMNRVQYASEGHLSVQKGGAAIGLHGPLAAFLSQQQNAAAISGAVGEIGVHHGRFWIAIAHTAREGEATFVCDLFEDQHSNIDGSGNGDRTKFFANVKKFGIYLPIVCPCTKCYQPTCHSILQATTHFDCFPLTWRSFSRNIIFRLLMGSPQLGQG
jgi:hypothetical protein